MKFVTKLWKRSPTSHATTVPRVALLALEDGKPYDVEWAFDSRENCWKVRFHRRRR